LENPGSGRRKIRNSEQSALSESTEQREVYCARNQGIGKRSGQGRKEEVGKLLGNTQESTGIGLESKQEEWNRENYGAGRTEREAVCFHYLEIGKVGTERA